ncbi:MAG: hypothetical protein Q9227_004805 [Pyrenula ochraceoflavens]
MEEFFSNDPDSTSYPRSAKRRKITTYSSNRSALHKPATDFASSGERAALNAQQNSTSTKASLETSPSVFRRVSSVVTGFGKKLFESTSHNATESINEEANGDSTNSRSTRKIAAQQVKSKAVNNRSTSTDEDELASQGLVGTPTRPGAACTGAASRNSRPKNVKEVEQASPVPRSSGRQRRKPRRFSDDHVVVDIPKGEPTMEPKSILTPSKRSTKTKKGTKRKNVAFQTGEGANDLDFEDIGASSPSVAIQNENTLPILDSLIDDIPIASGSMPEMTEFGQDNQFPATPKIVFEDIDPEIERIKSVLLSRLTHQRLTTPVHLTSEYQKVFSLLSRTVTIGEGNSMLILGSRGTGKRTLVENALAEVQKEHGKDFHTIQLNGLFQSDDKVALREIWRQLGREMEMEEDDNQAGSYADTLSSLLALLSHPDEIEISNTLDRSDTGDGTRKTSKSVIFVLNEFEVFASHARQTLLYNLFDIAQARKAPIAVIGLSTRMDVADLLEKRVKSRFSQRYLFISPPRTLDYFKEVCKQCLTLSSTDKTWDHEELDPNLVDRWNKWVGRLFSKDTAMERHLSAIYTSSKSIQDFQRSCLIPIANLRSLIDRSACTGTQTGTLPIGEDFLNAAQSLSPPDSVLEELPSLAYLQLAVLIVAARLDLIYGGGGTEGIGLNFETVYAEYVRLSSETRIASSASGATVSSRIWGKEVAEEAWDELLGKGFLVQAGKVDTYKVELLLEEIVPAMEANGGTVADELKKWCKEI